MLPDVSILEPLKRHGVPFVIVGGHAVNFHGYVRSTEDVDIVWLRSPATETGLFAALTELDAQYIGADIDPETGIERTHPVSRERIQSHHLLMLLTKYGFLDLFDYIPGSAGTDVNELFEASVENSGFRFSSLGWLRKMKKASGRTKDLLDLENLPEE
jgi:hypothetical protein